MTQEQRPPSAEGARPSGQYGGGPRGDRGPSGGQGGPPRRGKRPRYIPRRKVCSFCVDKVTHIDYKDVGLLRRFISDRGRIDPRRRSGTCARHQRALAAALKRARQLALVPFTADHIREAESGARPAP